MHHKISLYGSVTVGTKGQVVIPAEARQALNISSGDKLVVFGIPERNMLGICTVDSVESMLSDMAKKLKTIRQAIDKTKGGTSA